MNYSDRKAFIISAVCHGLLLGLIIMLVMRPPAQAEPQPMVMEMVAPPGDAMQAQLPPAASGGEQPPAPEDTAPQEPAPQEPIIAQPQIAEISPTTFEAIKDVPPLPEPEPEPQVAEPEPASTPSPTPAPQPAKKPEAAPKPQPKLMTADQFRRDVGMPKQARAPRARPQPATPAPRPSSGGTGSGPVRIDTSGATRSLQGLLTGGSSSAARVGSMSASEQSALLGYLSTLRTNIRSAWVLPDSVSGAVEWAEVLVTIEADGRISDVRIGKHQGSKEFLDSILRAVRNARSAGPTPSRQREHARYTLNLRDM